MALNSPSVNRRPASSAAHFRIHGVGIRPAAVREGELVIVQVDVSDLLAERELGALGGFGYNTVIG